MIHHTEGIEANRTIITYQNHDSPSRHHIFARLKLKRIHTHLHTHTQNYTRYDMNYMYKGFGRVVSIDTQRILIEMYITGL